MYDFMRKAIEEQIRNAVNANLMYARVDKTGDASLDDAVCQTIEEWGYKVAQNKSYIMVYL